MSSQPPSSDRPTGPPSGPLSGPTQPASVPPPPGTPSGSAGGPPSSGGSGGAGGPSGPVGPSGSAGGPGRPWWQSVPKVATIVGVIVAVAVMAVVFIRPDGGSTARGEIFLQPAGSAGKDPFTDSTARSSAPATPTTAPTPTRTGVGVTQGVDGSAPGLYGGTRKLASCDVEKQIKALTAEPDKNNAFAGVLGIDPTDVPAYLRALTPVQLRLDTRVTNHGFRDGSATSYQAVLQAGTAVLVDDRGVPRVRCACGNPLLEPVPLKGSPEVKGEPWPGYRSSNVVVVEPAPRVVKKFVMYDPKSGNWFTRDAGDTGGDDKKTKPPAEHTPSPCPSGPEGESTEPCPSPSDTSKSPSPESVPPRSPGSATPESPSTGSPSTEPSGPPPPPSPEEPSSPPPVIESPAARSAPEPPFPGPVPPDSSAVASVSGNESPAGYPIV
ncbi:DUF6777 domain-containing protein [Streptomyces sp. NBC_01637]|uniref:DUF6777 domain-containing protein n=1 Tax=unclassified Streptomyces TaxID=2593676 RepID=UPI003865B4D9|nr:hypothetical protein OH719_40955 [Streptomyces sp. NBC_01653]